MKLKFKAAVGSLLVSGMLAGAAVMPAAAGAHGNTGPLCWGNEQPGTVMMNQPGPGGAWGLLYYGESFRIKQTIIVGGDFFSQGHSASSYPADYWVYTPDLRCDRPPV